MTINNYDRKTSVLINQLADLGIIYKRLSEDKFTCVVNAKNELEFYSKTIQESKPNITINISIVQDLIRLGIINILEAAKKKPATKKRTQRNKK